MEDNGLNEALGESMERLAAAAALLERTAAALSEHHASVTGDVAKIVATVEQTAGSDRYQELERKLREAEQQIAELKAQGASAAPAASLRKTLPLATAQLLEKQGISSVDSVQAGALDAALAGLSLEQRIAVKAQLIRAGSLQN